MSKLPTKIYIAKLCTGSYDDYSETTIGFFYSAKEAAAYADDVNGMIASAIAGIGYHRYYDVPKQYIGVDYVTILTVVAVTGDVTIKSVIVVGINI